MNSLKFPELALQKLLPLAFAEDVGNGDVTSLATIPEGSLSEATLVAKAHGIIAGLPCIEMIFRNRGFLPNLESLITEGQAVKPGDKLMQLSGKTRELLVCERILLNILQRLSGIATVTHQFTQALSQSQSQSNGHSKTKILDTRKTLPGYRELDKYAVRIGGGQNHRQGLFDQILIKDNHILACGTVRAAVDKAVASYGKQFVIEAEVNSLEQLQTLLGSAVDIVMLDNMSDTEMEKAIAWVHAYAPNILLEASGNMHLSRVQGLANIGLDFISVGALTHSVQALDISLEFA